MNEPQSAVCQDFHGNPAETAFRYMCICTFFFSSFGFFACHTAPQAGCVVHVNMGSDACCSHWFLAWSWFAWLDDSQHDLNLQILKARMWVDFLNYGVCFIMELIPLFTQPCKG